MTLWQVLVGLGFGFAAGVLSGAFGVGGGIITTPAVRLLGGTPIQAVATPLPVIIPTAITGAISYWKAGEVSIRGVRWGVVPGIAGAIAGALMTEISDARLLLLVTAILLAVQSVRIWRGAGTPERARGTTPGWEYALAGGAAGFVSGLLGVGGGIIFVPIATTMLGMPLKRALGTSLVLISIVAIPGTLVHGVLDNIDWLIFLVLVIGVIPGAWLGARLSLRARETSLRMSVAAFLFLVAVGYGTYEAAHMLQSTP